MQIKKQATYVTSDGAVHLDHKNAAKHETQLVREKQLVASFPPSSVDGWTVETSDGPAIPLSLLARFIAANGDRVLSALTIKSNRGRKPASASTK